MIASMTGYGKGQATVGDISLVVEIKSVNHRYGDVTVKCPRFLYPFENKVKKKIGGVLKRGKIDVFINQDVAGERGLMPVLNRSVAASFMSVFEEMRAEYAVDGEIPLSLLACQKDVITVREGEVDESVLEECLNAALEGALQAISEMREVEGAATLKDMEARLGLIVESLAGIEERAPQVALEWQAKLETRLEKLRTDFDYDPQRVAQEIAIFADRCDISEEVTRFHSHIDQFRELFSASEPVGRRMDFLVQELNREVNTMGSKSNDAELTRTVVSIKAELEKIREQVQNIE